MFALNNSERFNKLQNLTSVDRDASAPRGSPATALQILTLGLLQCQVLHVSLP